jgi:hypothetical protein
VFCEEGLLAGRGIGYTVAIARAIPYLHAQWCEVSIVQSQHEGESNDEIFGDRRCAAGPDLGRLPEERSYGSDGCSDRGNEAGD